MKGENKMKEKTPQQLEAIKRMEKLKLMGQVIGDFKRSGKLYYSENMGGWANAVLYWVANKPEWLKLIKEFETETGGLVYHAQLTHTIDGDWLSLLFVSKYDEDWELDNMDLDDGYAVACVYNLNGNERDIGTIGIKPSMGGVVRTA